MSTAKRKTHILPRGQTSRLHIVQLVGNLPPIIDGVGDYACRIDNAFAEVLGKSGRPSLLACGAREQSELGLPNAINLTGRCCPATLIETLVSLQPHAVLLNFVGYAYAKRGEPFWLLSAIRRLRKELPHVTLMTMFHELYAFGWPWRSSFWLSPMQRYISAEIARLSVHLASTTPSNVSWLTRAQRVGAGSPAWLPVCSNVGEPFEVMRWAERDPVAVVFNGGGPLRREIERQHTSILSALRRLGIEKVVQFGQQVGPLQSGQGVHCVDLGPLPADAISKQLNHARLGILGYPPHQLGKSGVFAAYISHGVPALVINEGNRIRITPDSEPNHITMNDIVTARTDLISMATASDTSLGWYRGHAHSREHARCWIDFALAP